MDDVLSSHHDVNLLLEAIDDIEITLKNHGFLIKRIITNGLWYHAKKNLLKDSLTSIDESFTSAEVEETTFGHSYNWRDDTLCLNLVLNVHPKSRGIPTGHDLDATDQDGPCPPHRPMLYG